MKIYGDLQFQSTLGLPANPEEGQISFDSTTRQLYCSIYDNVGSPPVLEWVPLTSGLSSYVHNQTVAASVWTITHNLSSTSPLVQVYDTNGDMFIPERVEGIDQYTVKVYVGTAIAGTAMVVGGLSAETIVAGSPQS